MSGARGRQPTNSITRPLQVDYETASRRQIALRLPAAAVPSAPTAVTANDRSGRCSGRISSPAAGTARQQSRTQSRPVAGVDPWLVEWTSERVPTPATTEKGVAIAGYQPATSRVFIGRHWEHFLIYTTLTQSGRCYVWRYLGFDLPFAGQSAVCSANLVAA